MKTLNDIAPLWAEKIANDEYYLSTAKDNTHKLDMSSPKYCVVGEAHGFSWNYTKWEKGACYECSEYALKFQSLAMHYEARGGFESVSLIQEYNTNDYKILKKNLIKDFEDHWNERHILPSDQK